MSRQPWVDRTERGAILVVLRLARRQVWMFRRRPAGKVLLATATGVGAVAALVPTGLQGAPQGLGVVGGLTVGIGTSTLFLPLLLICLVVSIVAPATGGSSPAAAQELSGQSAGIRISSELVACVLGCLLCSFPLCLGSALVGLGDALRQGSGVWGPAHPVSIALLPPLVLVASVESIALVVSCRYRSRAIAWLALGVFLFFASLIAHQAGARWGTIGADINPLGPLWSHLTHRGGFIWSLTLSESQQVLITVAWASVALLRLLVFAWRSRSSPYGAVHFS
jgi:hypothetical protein